MGELEHWEHHFPIDWFNRRRKIFQSEVVRLAHDDDDLSCWSILRLAEKYHYKMPSYSVAICYHVAGNIYKTFKLKKIKDLFRSNE